MDLSIYRTGTNKFRMPYTKKSKSDKGSLLVPVTDTTKETFKNHLVTYTEECELIEKTKNTKEKTKNTKENNDK